MKLKGKYSDIALFIGILVVTLAVMGYILYGQVSGMIKNNTEAQEIEAIIKKDTLTFDTLIKVKSELPFYQRSMEYFDKLIPESLSEATIAQYLLKMAQKGNDQISSMKFDPPASQGKYFSRSVSFTISGGYNGLLRFLDGLQKGEKLVVINSVDIMASSSGTTAGITLKMFYLNSTKKQ